MTDTEYQVHEERSLVTTITKINKAIEAGKFICQTSEPDQTGIPLHSICGPRIGAKRVYSDSRWGYGYSYETEWGAFKCLYEYDYMPTMEKGTLPADIPPCKPITMVTATIERGWVEFQLEGETHRVDMDIFDSPQVIMRKLNCLLASGLDPVVCTKIQWDPAVFQIIRVSNEHVAVYATDAVWDPNEYQLVAAVLVGESSGRANSMGGVTERKDQGIGAIMATLADNGSKRSSLSISAPGRPSVYLNPTKRGYTKIGADMRKSGARAAVTVAEHPLCKDPSQETKGHFYVLTIPGEDLVEKFARRLDLAVPWAIKPDWAPYLLEEGKKRLLVTELPKLGSSYSAALRVEKNPEGWQALIADGLRKSETALMPAIAW